MRMSLLGRETEREKEREGDEEEREREREAAEIKLMLFSIAAVTMLYEAYQLQWS